MNFQNTLQFAQEKDNQDSLREFRNEFIFTQDNNGKSQLYFCGNSLGLQPKNAKTALENELQDWAKWGVEGHFHGRKPWFHYHKFLTDFSAEVVGAKPIEVVVMNQLTVNLHLLMASFYRPQNGRYKIIMEAGAFPSDMYAVESQVRFHGYNYDEAVIELKPRDGEHTLRTEDILEAIENNKNEIALVFFSGVQYYTGQLFDIQTITKKAHEIGALAGFDLAHAAGNAELKLHDWDVDFAAWCSYKYLNSGPGNVSGIYIHEKHCTNPETPRFSGWWGYREDKRFLMQRGYQPEPGAAGWQMSNAPVFGMAVHLASLELFHKAGIHNLRAKSIQLTNYLEFILTEVQKNNPKLKFEIITPNDSNQRGAQLSLLVLENGKDIFDHLTQNNIIADWREPNVIRIAPTPMYNSFEDVFQLGQVLYQY
jgi:kynureninase